MDELLKYALDNGIINLADIKGKADLSKREKILEKHGFDIWQGNDGYWRTYLPRKNGGRKMLKKINLSDLEDDVVEFYKLEESSPYIEDLFIEWNNRRLELKNISKATHTRNEQVYKRHFKDMGSKRIGSVEPEDFADFLEREIADKELTSKSFSLLKSVTKGIIKLAMRKKKIDYPPEAVFGYLEIERNTFRKVIKEDITEVFNDEELPVIINYLTENQDIRGLGILLLLVSGIRVGELVALKPEDMDENFINIRRTETRYKENGKFIFDVQDYPKTKAGVRTAIVPDSYKWVIRKLKMMSFGREYVFMDNGKRINTAGIRKKLQRVCENIRMVRKAPHKARKTYASILMDNNVDNRLVTDVLGHADIYTSENNYHRNRKSLETKAKIISNLPEFTRIQRVSNQ